MSGPIGVFDSGMGGLTVLREIVSALPSHDTIYLGDTARVPYGVRSAETIRRYARENAEFLLMQGISVLVVACNTATAVALDDLRERLPIPVFGVVEPGAKRAAAVAPRGNILVLATEATTRSKAYERAIHVHSPAATVVGRACPLFVPLAEEGWVDNDVARTAARTYLAEFADTRIDERCLKAQRRAGSPPGPLGRADRGRIDAAVLGCTHYPLLRETIAAALGGSVPLIDSAHSTAEDVAAAVRDTPAANGRVRRRFFVTDAPERFAAVGSRFLGAPIDGVEHVDVPSLRS